LQVNVSNVKKNVGIDVYTKFIATLMKNEHHYHGNMSLIIFLLGLNITCQNNWHVSPTIYAFEYASIKSILPSQFSWVVSSKQSGVNFHQPCSIWKCMIVSNVVTVDDANKLLFARVQ
jgi:hypothetical protein